MQVDLTIDNKPCAYVNVLEYNSVFYKMVKSVCNITEFTKSMLYNYIAKSSQVETWPT